MAGLLLAGASMRTNYLFATRRLTLWLIDMGFHVCRLAIVGLVLGLWH